ncbi:hypothetical protein GCM10009422_18110 [Brevundimonas kwangchunensis]|uniref:Uncharacterized protein n=1 Tax=Brevundimonas kwangchunensis TaxID=322163 RepID=A0ABN1GX93_9CAUL
MIALGELGSGLVGSAYDFHQAPTVLSGQDLVNYVQSFGGQSGWVGNCYRTEVNGTWYNACFTFEP